MQVQMSLQTWLIIDAVTYLLHTKCRNLEPRVCPNEVTPTLLLKSRAKKYVYLHDSHKYTYSIDTHVIFFFFT